MLSYELLVGVAPFNSRRGREGIEMNIASMQVVGPQPIGRRLEHLSPGAQSFIEAALCKVYYRGGLNNDVILQQDPLYRSSKNPDPYLDLDPQCSHNMHLPPYVPRRLPFIRIRPVVRALSR